MLTDKDPVFGLVQLATGFKRAEQDANANRRVGLSALRTHLLAIYAVKSVEDIGTVDAVETKGRLRALLRKRARSPAYVRNQLSVLNHVLRCAERMPGESDIPSLWVKPLEQAVTAAIEEAGAAGAEQFARTRELFLAFLRTEDVAPEKFEPARHIPEFGRYLVTRHGLAAAGMARTHKRLISQILARMGYKLPAQARPASLPDVFESEIAALGSYATNSAPELRTSTGKRGFSPRSKATRIPFGKIPGRQLLETSVTI